MHVMVTCTDADIYVAIGADNCPGQRFDGNCGPSPLLRPSGFWRPLQENLSLTAGRPGVLPRALNPNSAAHTSLRAQ